MKESKSLTVYSSVWENFFNKLGHFHRQPK